MNSDDEAGNVSPEAPPTGGRPIRRTVITLALVVAFLVGIDLLYQRLSPLLSPSVPGVTLTDVSTIDDLHNRFAQASGMPRLILFVSPT